MVPALMVTSGQSYYNRYLLNLLMNREFGLCKNLGTTTLMSNPQAMKASTSHDLDSLGLHGPYEASTEKISSGDGQRN